MHQTRVRRRLTIAPLIVLTMLGLTMAAGCDDKPAAESGASGTGAAAPAAAAKSPGKVLGTYENANDKVTIELKADGKATMTDEGKSTEVTWEMDGADKLVLHGQEGFNLLMKINSDGNLSDDMGMGGVFKRK